MTEYSITQNSKLYQYKYSLVFIHSPPHGADLFQTSPHKSKFPWDWQVSPYLSCTIKLTNVYVYIFRYVKRRIEHIPLYKN